MKIVVKLNIEVDMKFIYLVSKPLVPKSEISKWIRSQVNYFIDRRAFCDDGLYAYPNCYTLVYFGINEGLLALKEDFKDTDLCAYYHEFYRQGRS